MRINDRESMGYTDHNRSGLPCIDQRFRYASCTIVFPSLSLSLSSPYPSSLFLFPLIDLAFVHNRFHARPNFVTLSGGEHCGSDLLYTRNKQDPQLLDSVGRCFCPWNRYIPPARRSSSMRFMAYGRVLLTRFEWMHGGFCTGTCYVSKSIVSVVLLEIWLYLSSMDSRGCL